MKKTEYIQFKVPKSEHEPELDGFIKKNVKKGIIEILTSIIPKANPDFDNKIDLVDNWLVELDYETGIPQREIGIDKDGQIILKMPFENNYGYWIDNNLLLADFKRNFLTSEISKERFENYWNLLERTYDS